ncbi:uncharacterized protein LAESUDRAFT_721784 [Laetiporus sulphureus 93-53]|uniref:Uncharacterized protein n=1 Tax=Laetiporus sulphureus 93-53 TaxID=1314785 RepID=A0A165GJ01_9APHY|nr:uncharacterized protein LAESUDRAFT_721784 [Laetiporus sulphureus 93-53]KZT10415.1 hypothetical protein LAESUDRAFT_721784 [Laetiporus sulphureus 93-53]
MTTQPPTPEELLCILHLYAGFNRSAYEASVSELRRISPEPKDNAWKRERQIADAIAAVVTRREKEVSAVTWTASSRNITIHVAQNGAVDSGVVDHLKLIWTKLQAISRYGPQTSEEALRKTPDEVLDEDLMDLWRQTFDYIYTTCFPKLRARIAKRRREAQEFITTMNDAIASDARLPDSDTPLSDITILRRLLACVQQIYELIDLPASEATPKIVDVLAEERRDWARATRENGLLMINWQAIFEQRQQERTMASNAKTFDFRRFMEKAYSLHTHIQTLCRAATSSRRKVMFHAELDVVLVQPYAALSRPFSFSEEDIGSFIESLCEDGSKTPHEEEEESKPEEQETCPFISRERLLAQLGQSYSKTSQVVDLSRQIPHCECTLLVYHTTTSTDLPPHPYIGVSQLSCYPCYLFFEAYRQAVPKGVLWELKGTHGKIYPGWVRPKGLSQEANEKVEQLMVKKLTERLRLSLAEAKKARTLSDSTDASGSSGASLRTAHRNPAWSSILNELSQG